MVVKCNQWVHMSEKVVGDYKDGVCLVSKNPVYFGLWVSTTEAPKFGDFNKACAKRFYAKIKM